MFHASLVYVVNRCNGTLLLYLPQRAHNNTTRAFLCETLSSRSSSESSYLVVAAARFDVHNSNIGVGSQRGGFSPLARMHSNTRPEAVWNLVPPGRPPSGPALHTQVGRQAATLVVAKNLAGGVNLAFCPK